MFNCSSYFTYKETGAQITEFTQLGHAEPDFKPRSLAPELTLFTPTVPDWAQE